MITFTPLQEAHFPLLLQWMNTPHVYQWWNEGEPWTLSSVTAKYAPYVVTNTERSVHGFIIEIDGEAAGYIQYYDVMHHTQTPELFDDVPRPLAGIDLYIGRIQHLGKGYGRKIVAKFLDEHIWPNFAACLADPHPNNTQSCETFKRLGFEELARTDKEVFLVKRGP